jgi:hypothetical protein
MTTEPRYARDERATISRLTPRWRGVWQYVRSWPWLVWLAGINGGYMLGAVALYRKTGDWSELLLMIPGTSAITVAAIFLWRPNK